MKSKLLISSLLLVSISLAGCSKNNLQPDDDGYIPEEIRNEVKDSGATIDLTDLDGQTVTARSGDVLYVKLTGQSDSGYQWLVSSPTTGSAIRLVDHQVVGLEDPEILDGMFIDEWWIKVLEKEDFVLRFDYAIPGQEAEDSFSVNIATK